MAKTLKKKETQILNCNILKMARRKQFKFGKHAFYTLSYILVNREKLDLNALHTLRHNPKTTMKVLFYECRTCCFA